MRPNALRPIALATLRHRLIPHSTGSLSHSYSISSFSHHSDSCQCSSCRCGTTINGRTFVSLTRVRCGTKKLEEAEEKSADKDSGDVQAESDTSPEEQPKEKDETEPSLKFDTSKFTNPENIRKSAVKFYDGVLGAWEDLTTEKKHVVNKRIRDPVANEGMTDSDGEWKGPSAVMVVDPDESAYEKMKKRMSEAPIIQSILGASKTAFKVSGAKKGVEKIGDVAEDAREIWETSQNPWIYRISSVWDTMTAESDNAIATRELQRLDPTFNLEEWKENVEEGALPEVIKLLLEGNLKELKPWLGEAVYNKFAEEIRLRKSEGLVLDTNVLGIENGEIIKIQADEVNKGSPIILVHFMCQQINCVRDKEGEVVEGAVDDIRGNFYVAAFQREFDDMDGVLKWRIVDFMLNGSQPYV